MKRALHSVNIDIRENLFALEFMNDNEILFRMRDAGLDVAGYPIDDYERTDRDPTIAIKLLREIERAVKSYVGQHITNFHRQLPALPLAREEISEGRLSLCRRS
jgi:hypothetical protein